LADFGLSKWAEDELNAKNKKYYGNVAYVDPKKFSSNEYKLNEKSDVYSVGVLLWEISSGKQPFCKYTNDNLSMIIPRGKRENPISDPDIPSDYIKLYTGK
jgi:serine/threonine protein kinase